MARAAADPFQPTSSEWERAAAVAPRLAKVVLERAAAAYGGRLLVFKGPEIASYPPGTRFFSDLDLLTDDVPAAQSGAPGGRIRRSG